MSRAQKLVNWALAILARQSPPDSLNDQKALAELRTLFRDTEDEGRGTASERVQRTKETLAQHAANELSDHQAVREIHGILDDPKSKAIAAKRTA